MGFAQDFAWGAATASYQVEGATEVDGRGLSVWDMLDRQPGRVANGDRGTVACDHYHRWAEDVDLMAEVGLKAYRFSLSWPRILPEGTGAVNPAGIGFYDRLIDALLERGIQPWVTLFHWDYPLALYRRGGWLNPESPDWFADYAGEVVDRLGDRVDHWITQNEIQCFIGLGHRSGEHAPGLKMGPAEVILACHNALIGHGKAVQAIRARAGRPVQVGVAPIGHAKLPAGPEDVDAARRATFACPEPSCWKIGWIYGALLEGAYPEEALCAGGHLLPAGAEQDLGAINQTLDFLGFNCYFGERVRAVDDGWEDVPPPSGYDQTAMQWEVTPEVLYWAPKFLYERYGLPLAVTENGMANCDWVQLDGRVHDPQRIDFCTRYLRELRRAVDEGIDVRGYFLWTFLDNFEWALGYNRRFGLTHVDFTTGARTLKDSAYWYREVIASNGQDL